jgi:hypothetical protein
VRQQKLARPIPLVFVTLVQNDAKHSKKALRKALGNADRFVQKLNSDYTDPSGQ